MRGFRLKDPEFGEFHPTGLASSGILMSEACRGEGGHLLNKEGERFMARYAPEKMELGPRDLVSRAIETEIKEGRGFGEGIGAYVQMDLRHLGKEKILERLPQVRALAMHFEGVDIIEEPVPIRPSCHYMMGGIHVVDYKTCRTPIEGILAAGECACISIHGANRLGGNSVADVVLFGKYAGLGAREIAKQRSLPSGKKVKKEADRWIKTFDRMRRKTEGIPVTEIREQNGGNHVEQRRDFPQGKRNERSAGDGRPAVGGLPGRLHRRYIGPVQSGLCPLCGSRQSVETGEGGGPRSPSPEGEPRFHARADYPKRDDGRFLKHTLIYKKGMVISSNTSR